MTDDIQREFHAQGIDLGVHQRTSVNTAS